MRGNYVDFLIKDAFTFTPSDTVNLSADAGNTEGHTGVFSLFVGSTGNVAVVFPNGNVEVFANVPSGTFLQVAAIRVNSTSTTATNMLACVIEQ